MVDKIKGGLADNMTLEQIAEKHSVTLSVIESALADGIAVEMEHTDSKEQAEEIAKDHLFEDAEYYSKLKKVEKQNSKDWAKVYKASNFIEKGVCTYNDETIYLSQEALNKAIMTIKGRPVVIKHQKVDPSNMQDHAVGYVSDCGFCSDTAAFYCNFLVFDDKGKEVIAKDYSVSCAYIPKAFGKGGTWHNTPYDREVTELEFTHLALVPDPRYEDAKIYENAKSEEGKWVTIKGNHIFIKKGQSEKEAFDDFLNKVKEKDSKKVADKQDESKNLKQQQLDIILKENPMNDDYHTGIRKIEDIKTFEEAIEDEESFTWGDFDKKEAIEALKSGFVTIYSSKPIKNGGFVSTSKNQSRDYAGNGKIYEKKVSIKDIAWINGDEGQYAKIKEKTNSTDNTTKETYNMEKIEVEQGFLASLIELAQKPFMNSKKEEKEKEEDVKVDDDEMEYEGKKYSKKELVNAYEAACAGKKAEEEKEKQNSLEQEEEKITDEDIEFFNSMQKLMAEAQSDASDKVEIPSQTKGLELGSKIFG